MTLTQQRAAISSLIAGSLQLSSVGFSSAPTVRLFLGNDGRLRGRSARAPMFTFFIDAYDALGGAGPTLFLAFFLYVWMVWAAKTIAARRYRPDAGAVPEMTTSVIVPVFEEPEEIFRRALASIVANAPHELIAVVDGGNLSVAAVAHDYCDKVVSIPKAGKRVAIATGLAASDDSTEIVVVLDSDTVWERDTLRELLRPFGDTRVGGVTPRQGIFDVGSNPVRRFADWLEDLRYHLTVPAQSIFGQVGCLAGRTIAYRRTALEPAVERLVQQKVFGVPLHVGDDRVLTNELLRTGWRTVYQSTAVVTTDAPSDWWTFWKQQLRWGRSSQRETILSIGWLWRKPASLASFLTDIVTPFALYAVAVLAIAHAARGQGGPTGFPLPVELAVGYIGMVASIGIRQLPHFRRSPRDLRRLPLFVLQLTFLMAPIRIIAFATMLHQGWATRGTTSRVRAWFAATAARQPGLTPRLGAASVLAVLAATGAMLVSGSRAHPSGPVAKTGAQEVVLEAPSAEPGDK
jgi:cellobiuronic acid synthase